MRELKIIIMLSTFNGEKYIDEQLNSIYNQDVVGDITIYVRDDGSNDNTINKINDWQQKMNIIWADSSEELGAAKSFWYLFTTAPKGDMYAFCDQDDIWYSDKLSRAISSLKEKKKAAMYFSNSQKVDEQLNPIGKTILQFPNLSIRSQLICGSCQGCTMVMNADCRDMIISKEIKNIKMHDAVVAKYAIVCGEVIYDDRPSMDYRQHEKNVIAKRNKSWRARLNQVSNQWLKDKGLGSKLATELLMKCSSELNEEDRRFCECLADYRRNLNSKIYLMRQAKKNSDNRDAIRSFRIRILLNLY